MVSKIFRVLFVFSIFLIAGCGQNSNSELTTNYEELVSILGTEQISDLIKAQGDDEELLRALEKDQLNTYTVEYEYSICSSGGSCTNGDYNLTIVDGKYIDGNSLGTTPSAMEDEIRSYISTLNKEEQDNLLKIQLDNGKVCFHTESVNDSYWRLSTCFDESDHVVYTYHTRYAPPASIWRVSSHFSDSERKEFQDKLSKIGRMQLIENKVSECSNKVCKKFFTLLNNPSEEQYSVYYEHTLKDKHSKWDVHDKLEYDVLPKIDVEMNEDDLKDQLSNIKISCDLKEEKNNGLTCFNLVKEHGTYDCGLYPGLYQRLANSCSYCFSKEGYLQSVECFGDSKYQEETEDFKRYFKWEKI